ncbi:MAG: hypothetical protein MHPSP_000053 [Paramarteilia canceri]
MSDSDSLAASDCEFGFNATEAIVEINRSIDEIYGFYTVANNSTVKGFLLNFSESTQMYDDRKIRTCLDLYFIGQNHEKFKLSLAYHPYFYIIPDEHKINEVQNYLQKRYSDILDTIDICSKNDLKKPNHLSGIQTKVIKLTFYTQSDMNQTSREIIAKLKYDKNNQNSLQSNKYDNDSFILSYSKYIIDIREHDISFPVRFSIDHSVTVSKWYSIEFNDYLDYKIHHHPELINHPQIVVFAYDIECTKLPLKFPDKSIDQIMMISYMVDLQGYLITNREIISEDIEDFEFTPKPDFKGDFKVINCKNEKVLIEQFFDHIRIFKPEVFTTYNGDFFDWGFVEARAAVYNLDMFKEIGVKSDASGSYLLLHINLILIVFSWVKRDSYLPFGSRGLKAVAKAKLGYDPVEINPEDMCNFAVNQPTILANYSVSDAVATYYLYIKYIYPFTFALGTIIPTTLDNIARKGSGTLCEMLLMNQAYLANVIFPNKKQNDDEKYTDDNKLLISETYTGGHVEAIECGVFRSDIKYKFNLDTEFLKKLNGLVDDIVSSTLQIDLKVEKSSIENFEQSTAEIKQKIDSLISQPNMWEEPNIYHLDVGAMYPNIMLTNRLQPPSIVNESICSQCCHNIPESQCKHPSTRVEISRIKKKLQTERFKNPISNQMVSFNLLPYKVQKEIEKERIKIYSKEVYKKVHVYKEELRTSIVCQKENSFYIDTVRLFRDRRYEYKRNVKEHIAFLKKAKNNSEPISQIKNFESLIVIYDSLQLAHKVILNSFYGYVMRKGSRWFSMETGGITCYTGAQIIKKARIIANAIGRPLELDTDGIWSLIPKSFPDIVNFKLLNKKEISFSFPNALLNYMVAEKFSNNQYHELVAKNKQEYTISCENSIFFEVDGPYLAMILPSSTEEGKKLKKHYAVFNENKTLAELKGFEVKRRGEIQIIKRFQEDLFSSFLDGSSLEEAYQSSADVANYWLDILDTKCIALDDNDLFDLIAESKNMSRSFSDYGSQKTTAITTAKRLSEIIGPEILVGGGLVCKYIITKDPVGYPVTQRAVPVLIFHTPIQIKLKLLTKWLGMYIKEDFDIRDLIDWNYYKERLSHCIQKLITIPSALQNVKNPVTRVPNPPWVQKLVQNNNSKAKQSSMISFLVEKTDKLIQEHNNDSNDHAISEEKKISISEPIKKKLKVSSIKSFISSDMDYLTTNISQIISYVQMKSQALIWLYTANKLIRIYSQIPIWLYIAFNKNEDPLEEIKQISEVITIEKVTKVLPFSLKFENVYQISYPYHQKSTISGLIKNFLACNRNIVAFEIDGFDDVHFGLEKTSYCRFSMKKKREPWSINHIQPIESEQINDFSCFNKIYLNISNFFGNTICLFYSQKKNNFEIHFVLKSSIDKSQVPNFKNFLISRINQQDINEESFNDIDQSTSAFHYHNDLYKAYKKIENSILSDLDKDRTVVKKDLVIFDTFEGSNFNFF